MVDICLTPFKRRFVENWRKEVQKHLDEGSICRVVVAQIHSDESDCGSPDRLATPKIEKPKPLSREKTASEKLADISVSNTSNVKALPSVKFMYTNGLVQQNKNQEKLFGGIPIYNLPNKIKNRDVERNVEKEPMKSREKDDDFDKKPLVIVDPQLMTPTLNPDDNERYDRRLTNDKEDKLTAKLNMKNSVESKRYNYRLPLFGKCKLQSTEKNSFVVSRSNFVKYGNVKNHSFLTLPARFQMQTQQSERIFQSGDNNVFLKEKTPFIHQKHENMKNNRKIEHLSLPKSSSNIVWAW